MNDFQNFRNQDHFKKNKEQRVTLFFGQRYQQQNQQSIKYIMIEISLKKEYFSIRIRKYVIVR